jgi:RimJ/RimL family protein N-acetyltransferase
MGACTMRSLETLLPMAERGTMVRRFCAADVERFHDYRSDAGLAVHQGWSSMSFEDARRFVSKMASVQTLSAGDWIQLAIADPTSDELLGDLGLHLEPGDAAAEVGFTLSRSAQGRGHATRAVRMALSLTFAASAVSVVRAVADARNTSSVRVLERAGFARSIEQKVLFKGELCTEFVYVFRRADA